MPDQSTVLMTRPGVMPGPPRNFDARSRLGDADLGWIVAEFQRQCGAIAAVLSQHYAEERSARILHVAGEVARGEDAVKIAAVAEKCGTFGRRRADDQASRLWKHVRIASRDFDLLSQSLTAHGHRRLVITAVYDADMSVDRDATEILLDTLQPPLAAYFRLWMASRAQQRRSEALVSTLNGNQLAMLVLDRAGDLVHANHAAHALLDAGDGLRRNGASVTAIDLNDALRLQLTVEHVVTGTAARAPGGRLPVVHLRRPGNTRPLIVAVMPVEVSPVTRTDPATVLYAVRPDRSLDSLLRPACEHYGLSPVETRLVVLLARGATLADTARQLRVKEQTARAYLKQIFIKTDTNRQAELVSVMMASLMPALAPAEES